MWAKALPAVQIGPSRTTISSITTCAVGATRAKSAPSHHVVTHRRPSRRPAAARTNTAVHEAARSAPRARARASHCPATATSSASSRSANIPRLGDAKAGHDDDVAAVSRGRSAACSRPVHPATRHGCPATRTANRTRPRRGCDSPGHNVDRRANRARACPVEDQNINAKHVANYARKLSFLPLDSHSPVAESRCHAIDESHPDASTLSMMRQKSAPR